MLVPRTALHLHFQKLCVKRLISSAGQLLPVCCLCHGAAAPLGMAVSDRDCDRDRDRDRDHGPLHLPCHGVGSVKLVTILFRPFPGRGCPESPGAAAESSWVPPAPGPLAVLVCHRWGTAGGTEGRTRCPASGRALRGQLQRPLALQPRCPPVPSRAGAAALPAREPGTALPAVPAAKTRLPAAKGGISAFLSPPGTAQPLPGSLPALGWCPLGITRPAGWEWGSASLQLLPPGAALEPEQPG